METDIYVFSKPLQYFNIRNTGYEKRKTKKTLVVLNIFVDADKFADSIRKYDTSWDKVVFLPSKLRGYLYLLCHKCDHLFVELDASFVMGILHKLGRYRKMYIFEEGYGSYRTDRIEEKKGLKRWINRYTGVSDRVGFSDFLTGQYLYLPDLYRRIFPNYTKELLPFEKDFRTRLKEEIPLFTRLSEGYEEFSALRGQQVCIYLTSHEVDMQLIEEELLSRQQSSIYVKPHPHLRDLTIFEQLNLRVIRSNIMIEFLLMILIENNNDVTVYHENSTGVLWFQDRVKACNKGKYYDQYEVVASYIHDKLCDSGKSFKTIAERQHEQ